MKKFMSILLALTLCLGMFPMQAFAASNLAEGKELESLGPNETMAANYGKITNNYGTVERNFGIIINNYGTVTRNEQDGRIASNSGKVSVNAVGGEISTNKSGGTVNENSGRISGNKGTVTNNSSTSGEPGFRGTIGENTGTIDCNMGCVNLNNGMIIRNTGNPSAWVQSDNVNANYGTIKANEGIVGSNGGSGIIIDSTGSFAKVESNDGTINNNGNYATVKSNSGTVKLNHNNGKVYNRQGGTITENQANVYWDTTFNRAENVKYSSFADDENFIGDGFTISPAEGYILVLKDTANATFTLVNGAYKVTGITAAPVKWNVTAVPAVAEVEKEGVVTKVGDLQEELAFILNNGATVRLLQDMELEKTLSIEIGCTLDLNGHNIHNKGEGDAIKINGDSLVTIEGDGTISAADGRSLVQKTGELDLCGGTYTSGVKIANQTFYVFLGAGYAFYRDGQLVTGVLADTEISGPVTVAECTHSYGYISSTGVHRKDCTACNLETEWEYCTFGEDSRCVYCKALLEVKLSSTGQIFRYDGTQKEPPVTVKADGSGVSSGHYTVEYSNNIRAGEATVTVTGKEGYFTGSATTKFTIEKATPTLTAPTGAIQYGQKLSDSTLTGGTAKNGSLDVAGSWSWANGDTRPTADGAFPVTFTPSDTANYNIPENVNASVTVNPAAPKITLTAPSHQVAGGSVTVDCKVENPHNSALTDAPAATLTYKVGNDEAMPITDGKFTIPTETGVGTTVTVTATTTAVDGKYTAATQTATVAVTDKIPVEISGISVAGRAYNGKAVEYTGTPVVKTLDGTVVTDAEVNYTWSSGTAPTNAGSYTLTVAVGGDKYIGSTVVNFTIDKATVTITADNKSATVGSARPDLTYTVSGLADGEELTTAPTLTCDADMSKVGSYPIIASGAVVPATGNYNTAITYVPGTLAVTAKPSSGGSSGGTTTPPSQSVTTDTNQNATQTTATPTATTQGGTATATVSTSLGNEIVKQAVANKSETVVIAPKTGNATKTEVSIPAATVGQIGTQTSASLIVSTSVADVTIPNGGLDSLASAGGTVTVTAQQTGDSVELLVTAGGEVVESIPGGITLTVPAKDTTPGTVAMLVREDGTREVVRKSVAGEASVTVPLDGSAKLIIVDNSKTFDDVPADSWAADAVAFASAHELFNGTAPGQFSPNTAMSRGMLAVVLHNLESNPEQALTGVFGDVDNSQWYAEGAAWAAEQGIVGGYGNGQFGPNDPITREQLATMLWRYAGEPKAAGAALAFTDADKVSDYAKAALLWASENGVINGKGSGILDPKGLATRAEVAQMLKNFMK